MNITKKSDKIKASVVEKIRKGYSFMGEKKKHSNMTTLMGAAFLMATSAIGPGFLTQTSTFTAQYKSVFALVIVCTILLDVTTQLNIWSVIGVSGMRGQDIANKVLPGLGYFIAFMVALGGLAFNIGNVGGGALGLNVLFGIPTTVGTFIAGIIGILIFLSKDAKTSMDKLTKYLGSIMIIVVLYVAIKSKPPVGDAVSSIFHPGDVGALVLPLITLLGGSCGGYITFSGAHRLLDAGYSGKKDLPHVRQSVLMGVSVSGIMRILLFLAVLGVVTANPDVTLDASNPAADAFRLRYNIRHRRGLYIGFIFKNSSSVYHEERKVVRDRIYHSLHTDHGDPRKTGSAPCTCRRFKWTDPSADPLNDPSRKQKQEDRWR